MSERSDIHVWMQEQFRLRVYAIRTRQLQLAAERAKVEGEQWRAKLDKLRKQRADLESLCCPDCDFPCKVVECFDDKTRKLVRVKQCRCTFKARHDHLVQMIRRLAGICHGHAMIRTEWDGWGHGKSGARACGPGAWDNAIRELEDGINE